MSRTLGVVAALGLTLLAVPAARGGALAPSKASQLVTLSTDGTVCPFNGGALVFDTRIAADGTTSALAIPAGDVLVVSSFDGVANGGSAFTTQDMALLVSPGYTVATSAEFTLDGSGSGAVARDLTTPLAIKSGTTLCIVSDLGGSVYRGLGHGFLTKDK